MSFLWAEQVDFSGLARRRDGGGDVLLTKNVFFIFHIGTSEACSRVPTAV